MYFSLSDLFALGLALFSSLMLVIVAIQRVYVLEKRVIKLRAHIEYLVSADEPQ